MKNSIKFKWLWQLLSLFCLFMVVTSVFLIGVGTWSIWKAGSESSWWLDNLDGQQRIQIFVSTQNRQNTTDLTENRQGEDKNPSAKKVVGNTSFNVDPISIRFGEAQPREGAREVQPGMRLLAMLGLSSLLLCLLMIAVAVYVRRTLRYFKRGVYFSDDVLRPLKTAARVSIFLWISTLVISHLPAIFLRMHYPSNDPIVAEFTLTLPGPILLICLMLNVLVYILKMANRDSEELRQIV